MVQVLAANLESMALYFRMLDHQEQAGTVLRVSSKVDQLQFQRSCRSQLGTAAASCTAASACLASSACSEAWFPSVVGKSR